MVFDQETERTSSQWKSTNSPGRGKKPSQERRKIWTMLKSFGDASNNEEKDSAIALHLTEHILKMKMIVHKKFTKSKKIFFLSANVMTMKLKILFIIKRIRHCFSPSFQIYLSCLPHLPLKLIYANLKIKISDCSCSMDIYFKITRRRRKFFIIFLSAYN